MVIFHEAWFVTCEEAEHSQDECHNGTSHWEESCNTHSEGCLGGCDVLLVEVKKTQGR